MPRIAWVSGEAITANFDITNNSSTDVTAIQLTIVRNEVFTGQSWGHRCKLTESCTHKVISVRAPITVCPLESKKGHVSVTVPSNSITFNHCPVMSVNFELHVSNISFD